MARIRLLPSWRFTLQTSFSLSLSSAYLCNHGDAKLVFLPVRESLRQMLAVAGYEDTDSLYILRFLEVQGSILEDYLSTFYEANAEINYKNRHGLFLSNPYQFVTKMIKKVFG
jgi:hypothetical protein